jgi:outer membrane lipoprotein-sorting protein
MKRILLSIAVATIALVSPAGAQDSAARGLAIARESENRDLGWGDSRVALTMILQDRKGNTRQRKLRILALEVPGESGGDKSIAIFDTPADLKGTILLTHAGLKDDDQWLFLPALKRVKRISSSNKTGAFFGSEFAYEDISAPEIGKFRYNFVGQKPCGRLTCFVVERTPTYRNSGYSKLVTFYDTSAYRPQRVDYYDRKGKLLKVLTFSGYKMYSGKFWRAATYTMKNLKTGKTTVLKYSGWKFRTGLGAAYFDKANLRNIQ